MTCPDPTVRLLFVRWLFNGFQVVAIVLISKLMGFLWRMARAARRKK